MKHVFSQDQLKVCIKNMKNSLRNDRFFQVMPAEDLQEAAFRHTLERYSQESIQSDEAPVDVVSFSETAEKSLEPSSKLQEPSCLVVCVYCNLHLPRDMLQNHYNVHIGRKMAGELVKNSSVPHICDVCGFGFRFKRSLIQHWRTKCSETLAHVAEGTRVMSNENLRILVEAVVKGAERHAPVGSLAGSDEGNKRRRGKSEEKEEREEDLHEEVSEIDNFGKNLALKPS